MSSNPKFCIHILGNEREKVLQTLESISRQKYGGVEAVIYSLQPIGDLPILPNIQCVSQIQYTSEAEIPKHFQKIPAAYHAFLEAGTEYVGNCFDAVNTVFHRFEEAKWLYGVSLPKRNKRLLLPEPLSRRRFIQAEYEPNAIDPAAVFFSRFLIEKAQLASLHIAEGKSVFLALWERFFAHTNLYSASLYVAYSETKIQTVQPPFNLKRWFFEKNIPYLRHRYYKSRRLAPVIRFDHQTKVYYLSVY